MRVEAPVESPAAEYNRALLSAEPKVALQHLLRAAAAGCVRAQFRVGLAFHTGDSVPVDLRRAAAWYGYAAAGADRYAMANLGMMWLAGQGVKADELEAYTWIRSAVGLGDQGLIPVLTVLENRIAGRAEQGAP